MTESTRKKSINHGPKTYSQFSKLEEPKKYDPRLTNWDLWFKTYMDVDCKALHTPQLSCNVLEEATKSREKTPEQLEREHYLDQKERRVAKFRKELRKMHEQAVAHRGISQNVDRRALAQEQTQETLTNFADFLSNDQQIFPDSNVDEKRVSKSKVGSQPSLDDGVFRRRNVYRFLTNQKLFKNADRKLKPGTANVDREILPLTENLIKPSRAHLDIIADQGPIITNSIANTHGISDSDERGYENVFLTDQESTIDRLPSLPHLNKPKRSTKRVSYVDDNNHNHNENGSNDGTARSNTASSDFNFRWKEGTEVSSDDRTQSKTPQHEALTMEETLETVKDGGVKVIQSRAPPAVWINTVLPPRYYSRLSNQSASN